MVFLLILCLPLFCIEGIDTFSEYWQRFNWEMWQKGPWTLSTYVDLKSQNHFKNLHSILISERLQYLVRKDVAFEIHYTYLHERSLVPQSLWRWQHRFELELNKTFQLSDQNYVDTRNRLEIRQIEKNPKTRYRFRERIALVFPIQACGRRIAYKIHNEIFYDLSDGRLTQNRFSPLTLTFDFSKIDLDVFLLIRYFLHEDIWYRSLILGTQISF